MISPKTIKMSDFSYTLPEERIAKFPVPSRDGSKLLVYNKGEIFESVFSSIASFLPQNELMVFNNTKVIQARIHFKKETGAQVEVFLIEPEIPRDYERMFQKKKSCSWLCMIGNLKRWHEEKLQRSFFLNEKKVTLSVKKGEAVGSLYSVDFFWDEEDITFTDVLENVGELPIPPYLNRETQEQDKITYQTIYSKIMGSVAAPTAGLHFTSKVLLDIKERGIESTELTLHVGAGTFRPVKSETISSHDMHTEYFSVSKECLEKLIAYKASAIAVGTTTVRTLESLYYIGLKLEEDPEISLSNIHVDQWEPYKEQKKISPLRAIENILNYLSRIKQDFLHASTQIIIVPGYEYKIVKKLITNFHQPQSTLLLLVSAFVGDDWKRIYDFALKNDFRFLSYGDSSLLIPKSV